MGYILQPELRWTCHGPILLGQPQKPSLIRNAKGLLARLFPVPDDPTIEFFNALCRLPRFRPPSLLW